MILIGQYDSPFVRRVGIALVHLGFPFEHRPWSVFSDSDKIAPYNPLVRVPTLVLADGEALLDSAVILDYLDGLSAPDRRMIPLTEPERRHALWVTTLATGMAEKAVSLFYEKRLHSQISEVWAARCQMQMLGALAALEQRLGGRTSRFWFGDRLFHADVAVAAAFRFVNEAHPGIVAPSTVPHVTAFCRELEDMALFKTISQAFIPPA